MAKVIVYEGPDRVGKATQSKMMVESLRSLGFKATRIEVPVKNFLHPRIYGMLKSGFAAKHPYFFQAVQVANRRVFQLLDLPQIMKDNDYVIFDRWSPSTWVYGLATGLPRWYVEFLLVGIKDPDYVVILNGIPHVNEMRDVYEKDHELQARVRNLYLTYANEHPDICSVIEANLGRTEVHAATFACLRFSKIV
jgi:thymidylate kinase